MNNPRTLTIKRSLIVAAALVIGECMPYISRIPLAFVYGTDWIWRHTPDVDNFLRWNGMHLGSLIPIVMFGLLYIFTNMRAAFYASVIGHFAVTSLLSYSHGKPYGPDDFLGCFVYPFVIAGGSFVCGAATLVGVALITKLRSPKATESTVEERNENQS